MLVSFGYRVHYFGYTMRHSGYMSQSFGYRQGVFFSVPIWCVIWVGTYIR